MTSLIAMAAIVLFLGILWWAIGTGQNAAWEADKTKIRAYQTIEARATLVVPTARRVCPGGVSSC